MHTVKQRALSLSAAAALALTLAACGSNTAQTGSESSGGEEQDLVLSQDQVTLDGQVLSEGEDGAVTLSHDIVYYQEGQGSDYGEGTAQEEHSADEADAHLVVTIREAGIYRVSGELTQGQLAVDLGEDAQDDPTAVVTVILDGVDVTCTVAPAFMVYNVYECGSTDVETASPTVDTAAAGINVVLADGSENTFTGSHVARIYEEGTTDKLHKYDGAFYSKMSMNIGGESEGTGVLNIDGDNEGLDSELHLTINGGVINIRAQNDGINTNEDGVSVTTINGGTLQINAGLGAEGDGIDSNGHLVINGGNVYSTANERSGDGGLEGAYRRNVQKAGIVYAAIDGSDGFYRGHAAADSRSLMNVTFNLPTAELEAAFVAQAAERGLIGLKGHRSLGGCRASIYNAVTEEGCRTLAEFMEEFRKNH